MPVQHFRSRQPAQPGAVDAVVLDEERNALGRQRISHIRDDLRAWDRKQDGNRIRADW